MKRKFLEAEWKNLIMANYIVDPGLLKEFIPYKTELDTFSGNAYLSLVGFMFLNTSIRGIKVPFHINFEEVNLRFYVRYNDNGSWKRGVSFVSEIVPKPAISLIANTIYHEKYRYMPMHHQLTVTGDTQHIQYGWKFKNRENKISATTLLNSTGMNDGSEEEFIAEHYWGYSKYNSSTTFEYRVAHPKWKIFPVKDYLIECDFKTLYGEKFDFLNKAVPKSVFVAEGSAVEVYDKRKI